MYTVPSKLFREFEVPGFDSLRYLVSRLWVGSWFRRYWGTGYGVHSFSLPLHRQALPHDIQWGPWWSDIPNFSSVILGMELEELISLKLSSVSSSSRDDLTLDFWLRPSSLRLSDIASRNRLCWNSFFGCWDSLFCWNQFLIPPKILFIPFMWRWVTVVMDEMESSPSSARFSCSPWCRSS